MPGFEQIVVGLLNLLYAQPTTGNRAGNAAYDRMFNTMRKQIARAAARDRRRYSRMAMH